MRARRVVVVRQGHGLASPNIRCIVGQMQTTHCKGVEKHDTGSPLSDAAQLVPTGYRWIDSCYVWFLDSSNDPKNRT
jgi:hypothetical protein